MAEWSTIYQPIGYARRQHCPWCPRKVPLQQCESSALSERESLAERKEYTVEIWMKSCLLFSFFFSDSRSPGHFRTICCDDCFMPLFFAPWLVHIHPRPASGALKWVPRCASNAYALAPTHRKLAKLVAWQRSDGLASLSLKLVWFCTPQQRDPWFFMDCSGA